MSAQTWIVINANLSIFAVIGAGAVVRRLGWLTEEADRSLLQVIVRLLLPCLIFSKVIGNDALHDLGNVVLPPVVGFVSVAGGCLLALLVARWFGLKPGPQARTFAFCVGLYNYGYIPIPLIKALFGDETLGVMFVHNLGTEIAIWTVGISLLAREGGVWRRIINPPSVAIVLALALNYLGGKTIVPSSVISATTLLGDATVPLGLVLVGAVAADQLRDGEGSWRDARSFNIIAGASLLRLLILPVLFLLAARYLPATQELKQVMLVQAAMPAAVIPIILAKHYGGDPAVALRVALGTSILGLITIPIWISQGLYYLDVPTLLNP